jgi:hypothetical protein
MVIRTHGDTLGEVKGKKVKVKNVPAIVTFALLLLPCSSVTHYTAARHAAQLSVSLGSRH